MSSFVQGLVQKVVASVRLGGGLAPDFPYETDKLLLEAVESGGLWSIYAGHAVKKVNGVEEQVTIFIHELPSSHVALKAVRNAVRRLRTIRHPCILRFICSAETERQIMFATERVEPLTGILGRIQQSPSITVPWLIYRLQRAVDFLHKNAKVIHGNVRISSLFSTVAGELKLGGFELASELKDEELLIFEHDTLFPRADNREWPPEVNNLASTTSLGRIRSQPPAAIDYYMMARLFGELFPRSSPLPAEVSSFIQKACSQDPLHRPAGSLLSTAQSYFKQSPVIELDDRMDEIHGMTPENRDHLLARILSALDTLPQPFLVHKVSPALYNLIMQATTTPSIVSARLAFACTKLMSEGQFEQAAIPVIHFLFQKPDRGIRMTVLELLPEVIDRLSEKAIQEKVYPPFVSGFTDSMPALRDLTLKASILLAPKLTSRQLNTELLRFYARLQMDEQSGIRVNTLVCLGKIAKLLDQATCRKVLPPALANALCDPFGPSKMAAFSAIKICKDLLAPEDMAKAILPAVSPLTVDPDPDIRSTAFSTAEWLLTRLKRERFSTSPALDHGNGFKGHNGTTPFPTEKPTYPKHEKVDKKSTADKPGVTLGGPSALKKLDTPVETGSMVKDNKHVGSVPRRSSVLAPVRSVHRVGLVSKESQIPSEKANLDGWGDVLDLALESPAEKIEEATDPRPTDAKFSPHPIISMEDPWS